MYINEPDIVRKMIYQYYPDNSDDWGSLEFEITDAGAAYSEKNLKTTYFYDEFGNITRTVAQGKTGFGSDQGPHDEERITETFFDHELTIKHGRFPTKIIKYNPSGYVSEIITMAVYDEITGNLQSTRDPNNLITNYQYDDFNRKTNAITPDGVQSMTVVRWIDPNDIRLNPPSNAIYYTWSNISGNTPVIVYFDELNRELLIQKQGLDGSYIFINKHYDEFGKLSATSEPYFKGNLPIYYTSYAYDDLGRQVIITKPDLIHTIKYNYKGLTKEIINEKSQKTTHTTNAAGWLIEEENNKKEKILYEHYSNGQVKKIYFASQSDIFLTKSYDDFDHLNTVYHVDNGEQSFIYNAFGETEIAIQNGIETKFSYDQLGRMTERIDPDESNQVLTTWSFDSQPNAIGLVASISNEYNNNEHPNTLVYYYDLLSRMRRKSETIDGELFKINYDYDSYSRINKYLYESSDLSIRNIYQHGYLIKVVNNKNHSVIWELKKKNERDQTEEYKNGNGLITMKSYDPVTGFLTKIETGNIQYFEYDWDEVGNLESRLDKNRDLMESFVYDEINQLIGYNNSNGNYVSLTYDFMGNITTKSDVGTYQYGPSPSGNFPYRLNSIDNKPPTISEKDQNLTCTSFNKVKTVYGPTPEDYSMELFYGVDHNRMKQVIYQFNEPITSKVYFDGTYEKVTNGQETKEIHYIPADDGLAAVITKQSNGTFVTMFVHKDHLGSVQYISDENGNLTEERSFDPWGAQRDPSTWVVYSDPPVSDITDIGFTGHEQMNRFYLINMNGRVYDPIIGRFLSVDPIMASNNNFDGLSTYLYCRNNPLSYCDPDGNGPILAVALLAAAWTAIMNLVTYPGDLTLETGLIAFTTGAIAGFAGGITGGTVLGVFGGSMLSGMLSSSLTYSLTVGITTLGNYAFLGLPLMSGSDFLIGLSVSAGIGGVSGLIYTDMKGSGFLGRLTPSYLEINNIYTQEEGEAALLQGEKYNCASTVVENTDDRAKTLVKELRYYLKMKINYNITSKCDAGIGYDINYNYVVHKDGKYIGAWGYYLPDPKNQLRLLLHGNPQIHVCKNVIDAARYSSTWGPKIDFMAVVRHENIHALDWLYFLKSGDLSEPHAHLDTWLFYKNYGYESRATYYFNYGRVKGWW
jgi:RHS repeat-associated protein